MSLQTCHTVLKDAGYLNCICMEKLTVTFTHFCSALHVTQETLFGFSLKLFQAFETELKMEKKLTQAGSHVTSS